MVEMESEGISCEGGRTDIVLIVEGLVTLAFAEGLFGRGGVPQNSIVAKETRLDSGPCFLNHYSRYVKFLFCYSVTIYSKFTLLV